jgi:hypothetical protein
MHVLMHLSMCAIITVASSSPRARQEVWSSLRTTQIIGMCAVHHAVHTFCDISFVAHGMAFLGSDVEVHHLEKAQQLKFANIKVVTSGPLFTALETKIKYNRSTIKVTVSANWDVLVRDVPPPTHSASDLVGCPQRCVQLRLPSLTQLCNLHSYRLLLVPHPYSFNQIVFKAEVDWHERHELLKCM